MAPLRIAVLAILASAQWACAGSAPVTSEKRTEASPEAKLALQNDPLDADAHFVLASTLAARGEYDQAVVGYRRVYTLDPTHAVAASNISGHDLEEADLDIEILDPLSW